MSELPETPVETWVEEYLSLRNQIKEAEDAHAKAIEALVERKQAAEDNILGVCAKLGLDGLKTAAGTVTRSVRTRFWTQNWPKLYETIKAFNAPFLLEQRIHAGNMKEFLENNPEALPEGLQTDSRYAITVRKPQK
jgi:hypothetical protein